MMQTSTTLNDDLESAVRCRRSHAEHVDSLGELRKKVTKKKLAEKKKEVSGVKCMTFERKCLWTQIDVIVMLLLAQLLRPKTFNKDVVLPCNSPGHDIDALPGVLPRETLGEE